MIYENWWHVSSGMSNNALCPPLMGDKSCDCAVVGGGFAGLHAALRLVESGKKVVLLEKNFCGGSSSGQSGGFVTPESEEDTDKLIKKYGKEKANVIYNIPLSGLNLIINAIKKNKFKCDLRKQDSLYLSIKKSHDSLLDEEAETRKELGLPYKILDERGLEKVHPGKGYTQGLLYPGSYGINPFAYAQEMKSLLLSKGVTIHEGTEVRQIKGDTILTHLGSLKAKNIIVCIDKMKSEFDEDLSRHCYHIQTHVAVSEPLSDKDVKTIFPKGEVMCWDSRPNYSYYRLIGHNRLILGGSLYKTSYAADFVHNPDAMNKIINDLRERFAFLKRIHFTNYWSGLIDVTHDLTPIADYDAKNHNVQYAMGCAGLPWAAFCGDYLARRIISPDKVEDLSEILGFHRSHLLPMFLQRLVGKKIYFGLSHLYQLNH